MHAAPTSDLGGVLHDVSASDLVNLLPIPCLVTDQAARCIDGNAAWLVALSRLSLQVVLGRVRFDSSKVQARWEEALAETHATALGRVLSVVGADARTWALHLIPLRSDAAAALRSKPILVVFEEKLGSAPPEARNWPLKAPLTRAEREVLAELLRGLPAKAIATQRKASVTTVRNQIMAILGKTGHHSQKELMASFGVSVSALPDSTQHTDTAPG